MPGSRSRYTEVVHRTLNQPSPFVAMAAEGGLNLENISHGQLQVLSAVPAENAALAMVADQEASLRLYVEFPPPIMEGRGVVKSLRNGTILVVPMHADWFDPTRVHNLERQLCPHFFCGDQMTKNYMNFRNLIVAKYIEHPERRLLMEDCVGMEVGIGGEDMYRIFQFLESWGIINYCAEVPDHECLDVDSYLKEDVAGEVIVPSVSLNSMNSLIKFDNPKCRLKAGDAYSSLSIGDDISDLEDRIQEKLAENRCKCCSKALLVDYYESVKEGDVMLCLDCYDEGRFVIGHSSIDFTRVDSMKDDAHTDVGMWTDQETVLLLEALEIYKDDWQEIADHVGSKSKAQCILHFLRLPVEDGLLSNLDVPAGPYKNTNGNSAESSIPNSNAHSELPFLNYGNPVMALVAFLASSVGPKVAAACAHASLGALSEYENLSPLEDRRLSEDDFHDETRSFGQHGEVSAKYVEVVKSAVKAGLAAAAIKAKLMGEHEEREIQRHAAIITNAQLRRLDLKLTQLTELDNLFLKQSEQHEKTRQKFGVERAIYMASQSASPFSLPGNRTMQLMSPSSSFQPPVTNNMPHMQQPAFSFGPRLPIPSIHPSSSLQNLSALFNNAQGTRQSNFGYPMWRSIPGTSSGFS